jgi:hypothetical protein
MKTIKLLGTFTFLSCLLQFRKYIHYDNNVDF